MIVSTYLFFEGRCEEAIRFYAACTGGHVESMMTFDGSPAADTVPPEWGRKILNASLRIGDHLLMACDAPPGRQAPMGGFAISLQATDSAEAGRLFAALSRGGSVRMPMQETFWAQAFGMLDDAFGVRWMVTCQHPF